MNALPNDTSTAAADKMHELLRAMTPAQRIAKMVDLTQAVHALALAHIKNRYPLESEHQHRLRLLSRWVSADRIEAAFEWGPER